MLSALLYEVLFGVGKLILRIIYGKRYKEEYNADKYKMNGKAAMLTFLVIVWPGCLGLGMSQETEYSIIFLAVGVAFPVLIAVIAVITRSKKTRPQGNNSTSANYVRAPETIQYKKIVFYEGSFRDASDSR